MIVTYTDVPSELNNGKCLTTEISGKPYFSQQKTFLSNHFDQRVVHITGKRLQSKLKTKPTPGKAQIYETKFNSFCDLLENKAEQLCYWKQLKTIYVHSICRDRNVLWGEFHCPSVLFHSFWAELILMWGENRRSPRKKKTPNHQQAMDTLILDYLNLRLSDACWWCEHVKLN